MSAWPIDASSRCGRSRKSVRFAEIEIVAGVHAEAELVRPGRHAGIELEALTPPSLVKRAREGFRVELDAIAADSCGPLHRGGIRIDEDADADAGRRQGAGEFAHLPDVRLRIPTSLAGHLAGPDRHERELVGPDFVGQGEQVRPWITLDIELDIELDPGTARAQLLADLPHVVERDVPGVGAWMNGDPRRSGGDGDPCRVDDARHVPATRVAQRRDLVDVDAQPGPRTPVRHPRCSLTVLTISAAHP